VLLIPYSGGDLKMSAEQAKQKPYLFSGIQPSGEIHIGNYLGAIRNWLNLMDDYRCIFCIVDYHAMTQDYDVAQMQARIRSAAITNMAAGLEQGQCHMFVQSQVPEHTELTWVFNTLAPIGLLGRMTQFKEKSRTNEENINVGLFDYPVLQAADILLYRAGAVPVGDDQVQHIEFTRDLARKFNLRFGDLFPEPKALVPKSGARIMGLDGQSKMSKSLNNYIGLRETPDEIWDKLKPAFTDPARLRRTDPGNPLICNIYTLHENFSPKELQEEVSQQCKTAGIGCFDCKKKLMENMLKVLDPIREKAAELEKQPDSVDAFLDEGAKECRKLAAATMDEVRKLTGLR
jgi:tryptophanyl-tRNA synthetase